MKFIPILTHYASPYKTGIWFHCILLFGLTFLFSCSQEHQAPLKMDQPNIIFILADDLGYNEVGFQRGDTTLTPHIDALRDEGLLLNRFYVHAVCTPTRAAFLTGRYPFRSWSDWRPEDFGKPSYLALLDMTLATNDEGDETRRIHALPSAERTIAEALQEAGYFTAIAGKWGCGEWLDEHLPMSQGFDHQYGHYAWGIDYNDYTIPHNAPARFAVYDWHRNQQPLFEQGYSTDLIANEVVRLLSTHREKYKDQPFFFYVPFNTPHGPLEEIPRYLSSMEKRYAAIKCLDDAVGRIVSAVDQHDFRKNTLIVFTNDNGAIRDSMNTPFRGTKNTNYEGGVRVPCIFNWPGKIEGGQTSDALMHITDFYPTLVNLAHGSVVQTLPLDGLDMREVIFDQSTSQRNEIILEVNGSVRLPAIIDGKYKLTGDELYNLEEDPGEKVNIAADFPEVAMSLKDRLANVGAERPPLPALDLLMTPALPWIYGQSENTDAPEWVKLQMKKIRAKQPQYWEPGATPWPQAPKDGKIIYTGDGR